VAREPTASRAAAELNFIVDVLDIEGNDHLDVFFLCAFGARNDRRKIGFQVPSAEDDQINQNVRRRSADISCHNSGICQK